MIKRKVFETTKTTYSKMPASLKQISRENKVEEGPDIYGYTTVTNYQVLDQFGEPILAEGIVISQEITLVSNPYGILPKSIKVDFKQYVTDWEGKVSSKRFVTSVAPLPDKFSAVYEQDLYVNDVCLLEKLDIVYGKDGVEEKSNKDRKTRRQKMEEGKKKSSDKKEGTSR